jgi:hypothetical protein
LTDFLNATDASTIAANRLAFSVAKWAYAFFAHICRDSATNSVANALSAFVR